MEWIDVKDRLPPQDVVVLLHMVTVNKEWINYSVWTGYRIKDRYFEPFHGEDLEGKDGQILHWMPHPDPPPNAFQNDHPEKNGED